MIERGGPVEEAELRRTFNLGVGLVVVVAKASADRALEALRAAGETAWVFGEIVSVGADVPLLGQVPLDPALVSAGDTGTPLVLTAPESPAGTALRTIAEALSSRKRGLAGMSLGLDPAGR